MGQVRVLHVLHSMNCGGAETLLMHLYRGMDREQVQFDFLVNVFDEMYYQSEIERMGGRVYRMPFLTRVTPPVYAHRLYRFFKAHPYRIVHSHLETTTGLILREAERAGVPERIAHSHNSRFTRTGAAALPENLFKMYCRAQIVPHATHLFACSEKAAEWLYGKHAADSELLRNGIDTRACAFDEAVRAQTRQSLQIDDACTVFGHVGRFNDQKNHAFLLDIFAAYHASHPQSVLLAVGDGTLFEAMRAKAADLGVADSVRFLGLRSDVPQLLQAMDCFLLPSKFEGLPLVLVEAQAAGLPCLAADTVSPMADLSASPFRFLPLDQASWVQAMVAQPQPRAKDASQRVADAGYDSHTQAQKLMRFYLQSAFASSNRNG